jgi:hypothetical protein
MISIDEEHLPQIAEVAQALTDRGVNVEQILDQVGVISGSCDATTARELSQVKGVAAVEEEQQYQLSPPDSPIQ